MIQSMTGFGKTIAELPNKKVTVEIKALNSKQMDILVRSVPTYREKEMEIRSLLSQTLERGKVEFIITVEHTGASADTMINTAVLESYKNQIETISQKFGLKTPDDWFPMLMRLPEVITTDAEELDEEEWKVVYNAINEAINKLQEFRIQEGAMLGKFFEQKIARIAELLKSIEPYENERIEKIRSRIMENLYNVPEIQVDINRLEQEMIYYIEKLDINEEKSRLDNHLKYFLKTLGGGEGQGKKLGFIVQEIGREINTLGSKSNHAEMQQIVVRMKDELEQIKEQILNVL
ncbi:MAG: YicC family protein [Tannerella sp.]|nr:YicC family protein [Tannerella sp.]